VDFFEAQDRARRHTALLVVLFTVAVLVLVALTNILVMGVLVLSDKNPAPLTQSLSQWFDWNLFAAVSGGVVAVVALGTAWKLAVLSGGGRVVAEGLGGKLVPRDTDDPDLQRALNVVEEMAIASGTPVPPVYVLPREKGINAFAAGFTPGDAVIGITRGAVVQLNRDQMQGVIAHEFSHILNGDMRLNLRLMGFTHGILVIGLIGQQILRTARFGAYSRRSRGGGGGPVMLLGLGLMVVGYGGTFFGNLIKAAVSRQREFLADASAVQFTRNPEGIAGALKRIGGLPTGSALLASTAPEFSHAMFGEGMDTLFGFLLSTHPPLTERIRRVQPSWDGRFDTRPPREDPMDTGGLPKGPDGRQVARVLGAAAVAAARVDAVGAVRRVGQPSEANITRARNILGRIPEPVRAAAGEPHGARAVIYGLLLDTDPAVRERQLAHLDAFGDTGIGDATRKLHPEMAALEADLRLPVLDLAMPALHQLSAPQHRMFRDNLAALMEMDARLSLFEWCLSKVLTHHLRGAGRKRPMKDGTLHIARAKEACETLLSALARAGEPGEGKPEAAFAAALTYLQVPGLALQPPEAVDAAALNRAVDRLGELGPLHKRRLLRACIACVQADEKVTAAQGELVRAISDAIDCPMPPVMA
jgi:Zn-dependent protease with chaperone function